MTDRRVSAFRGFVDKSKDAKSGTAVSNGSSAGSLVATPAPNSISTATDYLEQALGDVEDWAEDPKESLKQPEFDGPDLESSELPVSTSAAAVTPAEDLANQNDYVGWAQYIDDESGLPYWYNESTGEARWADVSEQEQQAPIELQGVWEKYFDDDGNIFYYNSTTGASEWEIPANAVLSSAWQSEGPQSVTDNENELSPNKSFRSIRSARSFGLKPVNRMTSFSEKVIMIEDQTLASNQSFKSMKSVKSAVSFRLNKVPSVANMLKPKSPVKRKAKNGFQMLKEGASILREARDESGVQWFEFQSADEGPIFYATEDPESGQWKRPEAFDLLPSPSRLTAPAILHSPSDSSLEASNELVVDFFALDKDEALRVISPARPLSPLGTSLDSMPIAMLPFRASQDDASLTSSAKSPLSSRPPLPSTTPRRDLNSTSSNISPRLASIPTGKAESIVENLYAAAVKRVTSHRYLTISSHPNDEVIPAAPTTVLDSALVDQLPTVDSALKMLSATNDSSMPSPAENEESLSRRGSLHDLDKSSQDHQLGQQSSGEREFSPSTIELTTHRQLQSLAPADVSLDPVLAAAAAAAAAAEKVTVEPNQQPEDELVVEPIVPSVEDALPGPITNSVGEILMEPTVVAAKEIMVFEPSVSSTGEVVLEAVFPVAAEVVMMSKPSTAEEIPRTAIAQSLKMSIELEAAAEVQRLREKLESAQLEFSTFVSPTVGDQPLINSEIAQNPSSNIVDLDRNSRSESPQLSLSDDSKPLQAQQPVSSRVTLTGPMRIRAEDLAIPEMADISISINASADESMFNISELIASPVKVQKSKSLSASLSKDEWAIVIQRSALLEKKAAWSIYFDLDTATRFYCRHVDSHCQLDRPTDFDSASTDLPIPPSVTVPLKSENSAKSEFVSSPSRESANVADLVRNVDSVAATGVESAPELSSSIKSPSKPETPSQDLIESSSSTRPPFSAVDEECSNMNSPKRLNISDLIRSQMAKSLDARSRNGHTQASDIRSAADKNVDEDEANQLLSRLQALHTWTATNAHNVTGVTVSDMDTDQQKRLQNRVFAALNRCIDLLDRSEVSSLEHAINEKQIYRLALRQRLSFASQPLDYKHDRRVFRNSCEAFVFPSSILFSGVWNDLCDQSVSQRSASHRSVQTQACGKWSLSCFGIQRVYHGGAGFKSKGAQSGEPFSLYCARNAKHLRREKWNDFIVNAMIEQRKLQAMGIELLKDQYGGFLFYCPVRKEYSSTGLFDRVGVSVMTNAQTPASFGDSSHGSHQWNEQLSVRSLHRMMKSMSSGSKNTQSAAISNVWADFENLSSSLRVTQFPATQSNSDHMSTNLAHISLAGSLHRFQEFREQQLAEYRSVPNEPTSDLFSLSQVPESQTQFVDRDSKEVRLDLEQISLLQHAFANMESSMGDVMRFSQPVTNSFAADSRFVTSEHTATPNKVNPLGFESAMDSNSYSVYAAKISSIAANDIENPLPVIELVEFLLKQGLGKHALAALKHAIDVLQTSPLLAGQLRSMELALARILSMKLSAKFFNFFERTESVLDMLLLYCDDASGLPSNKATVMLQLAKYMSHMGYEDWAEYLLLLSSLLDPSQDLAHLQFSQLLFVQGDFRSAVRQLRKVERESALGRVAALWESFLLDLQGSDWEAVCIAYKQCFQSPSTTNSHRLESLALHSLAVYFMFGQKIAGNAITTAVEYLKRSLQADADNAVALFGMCTISSAYWHGHSLREQCMPHHAKQRSTKADNVTHVKPNVKRPASGKSSKSHKNKTKAESAKTQQQSSALENGNSSSRSAVSPQLMFSKEEIDSHYRRAIVLLENEPYRLWSLLAFADHLLLEAKDVNRAQEYYEHVVRNSLSQEILPVVALVHCYQYCTNDYRSAERLLLRALRSRQPSIDPIRRLRDCNQFIQSSKSRLSRNGTSYEAESFPSDEQNGLAYSGLDARGIDIVHQGNCDDCVVLYTAAAYLLWDCDESAAAQKFAVAALRLQSDYSPALRCLGLLNHFHHSRGSQRQQSTDRSPAGKYFATACTASSSEAAEGLSPNSPAALRSLFQSSAGNPSAVTSYAFWFASVYRYRESAQLLDKVLAMSKSSTGICSAAVYRSLGMMNGVFLNNNTAALLQLQQAFDASGQSDLTSLRLKAQLLMDNGEFSEARMCFLLLISLSPFDPISFSNLAHCVARLPQYRSHSSGDRDSLEDEVKSLSEFELFDPDEVGSGKRTTPEAFVLDRETLTAASLREVSKSRDAAELFRVARALVLMISDGGNEDIAQGIAKSVFGNAIESVNLTADDRPLQKSPLKNCDKLNSRSTLGYVLFWEAVHHLKMRDQKSLTERERHWAQEQAEHLLVLCSRGQSDSLNNRESLSTQTARTNAVRDSQQLRKSQMGAVVQRQMELENGCYSAMATYFLAVLSESRNDLDRAEELFLDSIRIASEHSSVLALLRIVRLFENSLADHNKRLRKLQKKERQSAFSFDTKQLRQEAEQEEQNAEDFVSGMLLSSNAAPHELMNKDPLRESSHKHEQEYDTYFSPKRNGNHQYLNYSTEVDGRNRLLHDGIDLASEQQCFVDQQSMPTLTTSRFDRNNSGCDSSRDINRLVRRVLMHQRLLDMAKGKLMMRDQECQQIVVESITTKSFVFVEEDWCDIALYATAKCEDWATLALCSEDFLM